ncbi:siderophore-interacting protein [Halomonas elongata]|uniref:siderophore-interacting protein n=1 Tax=Halomonas elongata TaxID=2746 RepID=UPI0038D493D0
MKRTSAYLPFSAEQVLPLIREAATTWELPVTEVAGTLRVTLEYGEIRVASEGASTSVRVASEDAGNLQMLRDLLTGQLSAYGLNPVWGGGRAGRQPANQSIARVADIERLSPSYRRVTIEGQDLARFADGGLHFRLLFGPDGMGWPETDENGVTQWPGGASAWHRPVYTTRDIVCDGEAARLSFDVFLHAGGRVTEWTGQVSPGDEVALMGPGGGTGQKTAEWQALVGDETALPVIARMLASAPQTMQGEAVIVVPDEGDIQGLAHPEGVTLRWALRSNGESPLEALAALELPQRERHVFFAAEKTEAQSARVALIERGLAKHEFLAATYWMQD